MAKAHPASVRLRALAHPARGQLAESDRGHSARLSRQQPAGARYLDRDGARIQSGFLPILSARVFALSTWVAGKGRALDVPETLREARDFVARLAADHLRARA